MEKSFLTSAELYLIQKERDQKIKKQENINKLSQLKKAKIALCTLILTFSVIVYTLFEILPNTILRW